MFVPTPGHIFCASDYSQLELCALAQSCLARFGESKLAETINSGVDVHRYLGTFYLGKKIEDITDEERGLNKVANFGGKSV